MNKPEFLECSMTAKEAYAAMYAFLQQFNSTFKSGDVATLLSGLDTTSDGLPMDDAYLFEWNECVSLAKNGKIDTSAKFTR